MKFLPLRTLLLCILFSCCFGSVGDNSNAFIECKQRCTELNCEVKNMPASSVFEVNQPYYLRLLGWDCLSECKYECMWHTIEVFEKIYKRDVPQFYGKWPFVRFMGMQEPMSVLASVLNLLANLYMLRKMKQIYANKERPSRMRKVYNLCGLVCVNTWIWSAIFHARDTSFTEKMDYFCAFALTLVQLNLFFVRFFSFRERGVSTILLYSILTISGIYYAYHIYFLGFIEFDYGYNMQVNIYVGVLNSICWISWSYYNYFKLKKKYVWRCAFSIIIFDALMVFEVYDFSPIMWVLDSHAAWHLSTAIIPFYWYRFIIDDIYYLENYDKLF